MPRPARLVGHVGVEQSQVELDVHGLLEELTRRIEPGFGRVDVLVQVEDEVVRHNRVAGGEESDQAPDQVVLGWQEPRSRSTRSSDRSTSSTVQVLRIAAR